ncbi:MAG: hypothetical protein AB7I59_03095 [Geminicoccaceae bacterium]
MRALSLAAILLAALPAAARGDAITDQLDQARLYYEQGDLTGAVGELEFALQALRGRIGAALAATFPAPPAGWTVEARDDQAAAAIPFVGGSMVGRTYRAPDGTSSIEAQLLTGGGFLQGLAGMFLNPTLLAAQPDARRVRIGRENAVVTFDPAERSGQLVLDLGGKGTVLVEGRNLDSGEPLVDLVRRWDLAKARGLLGG